MKDILLSEKLNPFEKEIELIHYFETYIPKCKPFLLGEFCLNHDDYESQAEYFLTNIGENYYRFPLTFIFLITEFAYWTEDWESSYSFWDSFQKKFNIHFSPNIYCTIRKGYRNLNVIPQPKSGFRWVNWCTMQSILGRNAIKRLAELIQYWKRNNINTEQIEKAFEKSYIVDLKLAVLSHLYQIEHTIVLKFLSDLISGKYQNCIYFRKDEAFINQFEDLLKQRLFYYGIFSSDYSYSKDPVFYLEDNRIKCQFIEDAVITPENVDIKRYKGQSIIANYKKNRRFTRWEKNSLIWAESFNTFLQSKNQLIEFYLEDTERKIFKIPLPILKDKDFWIFNIDGDLLNDKKDEINVTLEDNLVLQFVTTRINDLENLNIIDFDRYNGEEQYFILKFKPNQNLLKENIGNNTLIYELSETVRFSYTPLVKSSDDKLCVINTIPEIFFSKKLSKEEIMLDINGKEISEEYISNNISDEDSYWILNLEKLYIWNCFGKNRITILHEKSFKDFPFEFYYLRDLNALKLYRFRHYLELKIDFNKRNQYSIESSETIIRYDPEFTLRREKPSSELSLTFKQLKSDDEITIGVQTVTPDARIVHDDKQILSTKEITLRDLINLPIIIVLRGQPQQNFILQLISSDSRILYNFGNDFKFSDVGKFHIGRLFWQKYYLEIKKILKGTNGYLRFTYDYSIPFTKPFSFNIARIYNQKPIVNGYNISLIDGQLFLQLEIEKLPINSLSLFLFKSDFSDCIRFPIENLKRLPSITLKIQKSFIIPEFADDGIVYACITANDLILDELKQIILIDSYELNPTASFINYLYHNFVIKKKSEIDTYKLYKNQSDDLTAIFLNERLLSKFISFLKVPEIDNIFQYSITYSLLENKVFYMKAMLTASEEKQIEFLKFIIKPESLDFFRFSGDEKNQLKKELSQFRWKNTGQLECFVQMVINSSGHTQEEKKDWYQIERDNAYPPFHSSDEFIRCINEEINCISNESLLNDIKSGKFEHASDKLKGWHMTLRKNEDKLADLFYIFYNYWFLSESSQKAKNIRDQIKQIFKENPMLFLHMMVFKEMVYNWDKVNMGIEE